MYHHTPSLAKTIVVFVPGYKGSLLNTKNSHNNVWINLEEILFGSSNLALNTSKYTSIEEVEYEQVGILEEISIIPPIIYYNVYGECIEALRGRLSDRYEVKSFSYDWRLGADANGEKLLEFIKSVRSESLRPIKIITHSMGGLVSTMALRSENMIAQNGVPLVDSIIYLGSPFQGVMESFRDMQYETAPILTNKHLLDRKAYSSFESAFDLMPDTGGSFDPEGEIPNMEIIYNLEKWDSNSWGLFGFREDELFNPEGIRKYVEYNLERASKVHQVINSDVTKDSVFSNMRVLNFIGIGTPTLAYGRYDQAYPNSLSFDGEGLTSDGDGVVTKESARLPKSYSAVRALREVELTQDHVGFCLNARILDEIGEFLQK